jgi:hypothetical protein
METLNNEYFFELKKFVLVNDIKFTYNILYRSNN